MEGVGKVVLAVGVYDTAGILADYLDWYLHIGVDFIVALDYGSTDGSVTSLNDTNAPASCTGDATRATTIRATIPSMLSRPLRVMSSKRTGLSFATPTNSW